MKGKGIIVILIVFGGIFLLVIACGGGAYLVGRELNESSGSSDEQEGSVSGAEDTDSQDDSSEEDSSLTDGLTAEWPDDMPGEVPEFTWGNIVASSKGKNPATDQDVWTVTFDSMDEDASEKYKQDLESNGWSIDSYSDVGDLIMIGASYDGLELEVFFKTTLDNGSLSVQYST